MRTNQKLEVNLTENNTMDVNTSHEVFGHPCIEHLKMTANMQNITLKGEAKPCYGCMMTKAKAKGVKKSTDEKATEPGERLFVDISGPFAKTLKGNRYWLKMVDDYSRYSESKFIKQKMNCVMS